MKLHHLVAWVAVALLFPNLSAAEAGEVARSSHPWPREGHLNYSVMRGDGGFVVGRATVEWHIEGKTYALKSTVETAGLVALFKSFKAIQESHGEVTPSGLRPSVFVQERGKGTEKAQFDWLRGTVRNGETEDPLVAGTQDVLSVYYQLALMSPTRGFVEIPIATGRKLALYRFEVIATELLTTDDGPQKTVHLRAKTGNDTMDLWLAPQFSPLPLRITILDKKGDLYDQRATLLSR
ncbi:MAG: DUF3108 domain-containing protein [Rhodocyclaceae bacterium]|nr:DUF3108 domain-containing protein [Rhodocyclaceae bacterium]